MPLKLQPGMSIGGYTLVEPLHEGGMSRLWSVTHPDQAMPLLMKLPRIDYGEAVSQVVSFEVERMLMPMIGGEHVPRYVASGEHEDQPWLVMQHVAGETLQPLLEKLPLAAARVAAIGAMTALALEDLHHQRVVHLDVKPGNVLLHTNPLDGRESAVLLDFGLSHHADLPDLLAEQFHVPMGTAPYIAPEQVLGVRDEPRSDLFALGVTLFQLATGKLPFGAPASTAGMRRRLHDEPPAPRQINPAIPRWLQEIILRCLEVDPDRRHASSAQLAFDLQHPEQVPLTARADRLARHGWASRALMWLSALGTRATIERRKTVATRRAPLIMTAIDLKQTDRALDEALRDMTTRIVQTAADSRLACVTVLRVARIGIEPTLDIEGRNRHVKRLIALRDWARSLPLEEHRITFHVLESSDVADALVDYARSNRIDQLIMGARGVTGVRRMLGSVSSRVVAEANCTVTVVRAGRGVAAEEAAAGNDAAGSGAEPE
ncbi:MAG: universal stress protein [Dokdonella sp.]|nr:universal stress protein [Dokdonella sp.]